MIFCDTCHFTIDGSLHQNYCSQAIPQNRYVVRRTGTIKRPFDVWDTKGGWVCSSFGKELSAANRAAELNTKNEKQ